jgi:hypothetical protein
MVIWELVGGTTEYTSGAGRPYAERVYRVHAGKLEDATPEFCRRFSQGLGKLTIGIRRLHQRT